MEAVGDQERRNTGLARRISRRISRRRALAAGAGLGAAGMAAAGGWLALRGSGGQPPAPATDNTLPTGAAPAPPTGTATVTRPSLASLLQRDDASFQRRGFAPGDLIDWPSGVFFMDVESGAVEGHRLAADDPGVGAGYWVAPGGDVAGAAWSPVKAALVHRPTGQAFSWDPEKIGFTGASSTVVVFAEMFANATRGRMMAWSPRSGSAIEWALPESRYRTSPAFSPDGRYFYTWTWRQGRTPVLHRVDLTSSAVAHVWVPGDTGGEWEPSPGQFHPRPGGFTATLGWIAKGGRYSGTPGPEPLVRDYAWDGTLVSERRGGLFPRKYAPDGSMSVEEEIIFERVDPNGGNGVWERWPAVRVLDTGGDSAFRIKGITLQAGDSFEVSPWLPDGSGFVATFTDAEATDGTLELAHAIFSADGALAERLPLPARSGKYWFDTIWVRTPLPSPHNPDLIAFGRLDLYNRRTGRWLSPTVASEEGPAHIDTWAGGPREMVFALPHGGHGGTFAPVLPGRRLERPPFADEIRVRVAGSDNLNLRTEPSLTAPVIRALPAGTELRRHDVPGSVSVQPSVEATWLAVETLDGAAGWCALRYLEWI